MVAWIGTAYAQEDAAAAYAQLRAVADQFRPKVPRLGATPAAKASASSLWASMPGRQWTFVRAASPAAEGCLSGPGSSERRLGSDGDGSRSEDGFPFRHFEQVEAPRLFEAHRAVGAPDLTLPDDAADVVGAPPARRPAPILFAEKQEAVGNSCIHRV